MGPLNGVKVVELAGIGPTPMCAMLLADLGATVLRIERPVPSGLGVPKPLKYDLLLRGRSSITVDLKSKEGVAFVLDLIERADILLEGFRPGTMERLGLGPEKCLAHNPKLVYGRMTGWGQGGPLASTAGHDLNYISISGALHAIGRRDAPPTPPLNLVGDFGGGAVMLAYGLLAGMISSRATGVGQVVDASMSDGAASLMTAFFGLHAAGMHNAQRGTNILDSGAPYYDVYECADGKHLAVAAIESKFRQALFKLLQLDDDVPDGSCVEDWPELRQAITERILTRTQSEWTCVFSGSDACVTPVLSMEEALTWPHNVARGTFAEIAGVPQPAPTPRFSNTPPDLPSAPKESDIDTPQALMKWNFQVTDVQNLVRRGVLKCKPELSETL